MTLRLPFPAGILGGFLLIPASLLWLTWAVPAPAEQAAPPAGDPVARLIDRVASGEATLAYRDDGHGYLASVLRALDLNVDSQALVFAKNSFQATHISPSNPRAIYFNDDVSVGYIPGADLIEFASVNARDGIVFYTLDARNAARPLFDHCDSSCHGIGEVGTLMVRSVFPSRTGQPFGSASTDHRTPFAERWGGWYVTGTHGTMTHRGNAIVPDRAHPVTLETEGTRNLTSLEGRFDISKYPAGSSDLVALMTLEHQTRMTNLILGVSRNARAVAAGKMNREWLDRAVDDMLAYMLFTDEAPLDAPVRGTSSFTESFAARGPRDSRGRSLRDFDLETRLFRYPLSYMIYSGVFDGLEPNGRDLFYQRLYAVLTGKEENPAYARLTGEERQAVLEILRETKPGLPAYFHEGP